MKSNVFFDFCKKYWTEIVEFADAFYAWFKGLFTE